MLKNVIRRTWSVLIALVMIWTTFCIGQPLTASASVASTTPSSLSGLYFVVPEAIYLKPVYNSYYEQTSSTFQFYVNNTLDSSGNIGLKTGEEKQGDLYFRYTGATSVKLSFEWLNTSGQATSGGAITVGGTTLSVGYTADLTSSNNAVKISAGTSPNLNASVTGAYIRWTISFKDPTDFRTKTAQAYTYVYKPYIQPVGSSIKTENDRGDNHFGGNLCWISGVHDTSADALGDYYPNADTSNGLLAFSSSDTSGTKDGDLYLQIADRMKHTGIANAGPQNWLNTTASPQYMPDKSFRHQTNDRDGYSSGDVAFNTFVYSPTALLTVDVSRYTNLNQVPNLSLGLMVTDDESSDSGAAYFVANYTGDPAEADDRDYNKNWDHARGIWNKYNEDTIWSDGEPDNLSASESEGIKYNGKWKKTISGTGESTYYAGMGYMNHQGSDTIWNNAELRMKVTRYNKATLRSAVNSAINKAPTIQAAFYDTTSSAWTEYQNLFKAASMALTKVDGTFSAVVNGTTYSTPAALATALNGAVSTLTGGTGRIENRTATQTNIALRKVSEENYVYAELPSNARTNTTKFKSYDTVTFTADTIAGYSVIGVRRANSAQAQPTAGSSAEYPTFTTSDNGALISGTTVKYVHADTTGTDSNGNIYYTYYYLANTYTVHFDANGGTGSMQDQPFTYDVAQDLYGNTFERQGYTFNGWAKTSTGAATYANNANVKNLTSTANATVNLFATWKAANYTILYDTAGGSFSGDYMSSYTITDTVTLPAATKSGYSLTGWRADDSGNWGPLTYTPGNPVSGKWGNVKFTAVWKSNNFSVAFNPNGGTGASMSNQSFVYGTSQALTANAYSRDGFTFRGWALTNTASDPMYADKEVVGNLTTENNAVVTLYAVWGAVNYTITYSTDSGSINDTVYTKTYTVNDQIGLPTNVTKTGYQFDGWKPANTVGTWRDTIYTGTLSAGMIGNVTLQAQWSTIEFTISYEYDAANGGQIVGTRYTTTYDVTKSITLPSANKVGYVFNGWLSDGGGNWGVSTYNAGNISAGRFGNVLMTAQWTGKQYYVQFNGNGSTSGTMFNQSFTYGESAALNPNEYTRNGYSFLGWAISQTATTTNYPDQGVVSNLSPTAGAVVTLYAVWQKNSYTVTYDPAGGTVATPGVTQFTITDTIRLPVVSRNGFDLLGWVPTSENGSWHTYDTYSGTTIAAGSYGSITLQAQWTKNSYTITYDAQGGTMSGTYTTTYDVDTQIVLPTVTRTGYNFGGWRADSAWNNILITDNTAPANAQGNVKLTAQWTRKTYLIRFNANGGFGTMNDQLMRFDEAQNLTPVSFTRDGYTFDSWATSPTGSAVYFDGDRVINLTQQDGGVVNLYALWTARKFNIAYNFNGADGNMFPTTGVEMDGAAKTLRPYNGEPEVVIGGKRYAFSGWAYTKGAADAGIISYEDRASFSMNSTVFSMAEIDWSASTPVISLYAVWTEQAIELVIPEGATTVIDADRGYIYGLKAGVSRDELITTYLEVIGNGRLEVETGAVGTGSKVQLINNDTGAVLAEYEIVIFGDIDGDGLINSTDYTAMRKISAGMDTVNFNSAKGFACDLYADGDINSTDLTRMRAISSQQYEYDQATRNFVANN